MIDSVISCENIENITASTKYVEFHYLLLPRELGNVSATTKSMMIDTLCDSTGLFSTVYTDDYFIFSKIRSNI